MESWYDDFGNSIVYDKDFPQNIYCRLHDSQKFLTLRVGGFAGTTNRHRLSYHNPHDPFEFDGKLHYKDGNVYRDGESLCFAPEVGDPIIFHKMRKVELYHESIVPLPTIREKEYLLGSYDGNEVIFIYTSYDKFNLDPRRFFIGDVYNMESVEILSYTRYRDGGTTFIKTPRGTLHVPTPFEKHREIMFEGTRFFEFEWEMEEREDKAIFKGDPTERGLPWE